MSATQNQIRELAAAIAAQAQAIADGAIPEGQQHAQVSRLASNVDTLRAWTPDDRTPEQHLRLSAAHRWV